MNTRRLGKTNLQVSEIGFGGEWLERHPEEEGVELIHYASEQGINILDCWMADPTSRDIIGKGIRDNRSHWYIQGHIGSTWKDGQYFRSRDIQYVRPAFEDLLQRLQTDYIDFGFIHCLDEEADLRTYEKNGILRYLLDLKAQERDYSVIATLTPKDTKGTCVYCKHCHPCPAGLDIGLINKYYDLSRLGDVLAKEHYLTLEKTASDCLQCGHCNSRCPFSVDQMARMEEIQKYFG